MFERFADGARQAVVRAQECARDLGERRIGPAHLLLGVAGATGAGTDALRDARLDEQRLRVLLARSADDGLDAEALASVGIDLDAVRERAEQEFGKGALGWWRGGRRSLGHLPFTRGSKASLQQALRSAVRLGGHRIDSGHLVLGVLAVDDDLVRRVLSAAGTGSDALSADVEHRLRARAA